MNENILIKLLVIIFFLLPLWLVIYYEINNKIKNKKNYWNTWNTKIKYYIRDIKVNHKII